MRWIEIALSYDGLLALCLAMPKHYRQVFVLAPAGTSRYLLKIGGWLSLSASLAASVATNGWSFGPVEWIGMLAVAGLMIVFMLPYVPRMAALAGMIMLLSAPLVILL
jgi:hypothetical protein